MVVPPSTIFIRLSSLECNRYSLFIYKIKQKKKISCKNNKDLGITLKFYKKLFLFAKNYNMDKIKPQKYMNPITFEAEMFVNNLESLSKTYHQYDAVLISSLEKVMNAIETFLDSNPSEILATENTILVACNNLNNIKRIYHCSNCKTDLGKSVEKVTLHLIDQCVAHGGGERPNTVSGGISNQTSETNSAKVGKEREQKKTKGEVRKETIQKKQERRLDQAVKLTKKTRSLLTTDFNQFFVDHVKIGSKLKFIPDYDLIENDLMAVIKPLFPNDNVKIYKFGSRLAGIGTRESDLDLFIDIGDTFNIFQNRADKETLAKLQKVGISLMNHSKSWKGIIQIDKARVPIIKIIHAHTGIECDINFSNSLGTINTKFLEFIFNLQPIARLLCIFLKKWLNRTSLNKEISTYSIILMVIFYLQTEKALPSVETFQANIKQEKALTVGPWLCSYATLTLNDLNIKLEDVGQPNLLKFIRGFFMFYTSFDFDQNVVCPYLGKTIKKADVNKLMPRRYTDYVSCSPDYVLQLDKSIVVQDPIQLNHNVTKGLSAFTLQLLKTLMVKSLDVINETFLF
ncbi:terminal uridylyltransferase Tailor [Lucilia cuprina]|uniref:terminal uridylyltransferase Tailor n=1 Tax=Lucilia cuprina TaxID=7375 RepID=UPI001F062FA9|nr:terminal uridylyltransferase Tailor [Lucilia cuprina]